MIKQIITICLKKRFIVIGIFCCVFILGIRSAYRTPVDAFPDTTPIQVQINTTAPALGPLEIERQITLPVELSVSGLPGLAHVRSISKFGLSQIVATFEEGTNIYTARQLIMERISGVSLPQGIDIPRMGPISTGLGEVFHYLVSSKDSSRSLTDIRTIHDWIIKPQLQRVPGVAEINSWGGFELQYQVIVKLNALIQYDLTLDDVYEALKENNTNVGGGRILTGGQAIMVQGLGKVTNLDQIRDIVIKAEQGVPIYIHDIADVQKGHEIRQGAVSAMGKGEAVLGLGFMLMGENSKTVTEALRKQLDNIRPYIPEDIQLNIVYDRADLVGKVIKTVQHNLLLGAILVVSVLFLILGNLRAGILVACAIPFSMLFAFLGMEHWGITASLLSLGALDFGLLVDGSIVMTDANLNALRNAGKEKGKKLSPSERMAAIASSTNEVARPVTFGMLIIALVFLPILTLEGIEGKMFRPMALTFIFALLGALLIALFLNPILSYFFLSDSANKKQNRFIDTLKKWYKGLLSRVINHPKQLIGTVIFAFLIAGVGIFQLGSEFIPRLSEGSIVINVIRLAGTAIEESVASNSQIEKLLLKKFPNEITDVWSRIGTAEVATDPMGTELTDIFIMLKPRSQWKRAKNQQDLVEELDKELSDFPGVNMIYTQPIEMRLNEMISGIKSDVAIKIYGDELDKLFDVSNSVQKVLVDIKGSADVSGEQVTGQPTMQFKINRKILARHGIRAQHVLDIIEIIGNHHIGDVQVGQRIFPLTVRLSDQLRTNPELLSQSLVPTRSGTLIPLSQLADMTLIEGPSNIQREWGRRFTTVQCNVRGRDVVSFVQEVQKRINKDVKLPEGYVLSYSGQFENLQRSKIRLATVIPVTLIGIFFLLLLSLRNIRDVIVIYTGIPFALIGGVFSLWIRGMPFSISAAVGFIALSGIAVLNGQILVDAIKKFISRGVEIENAVQNAAISRLQPVLATALTDMVGFLPMAFSIGVGAEVQRPLATVVVGGLLTSTILTLLVIPALYKWFVLKPNHGIIQRNLAADL